MSFKGQPNLDKIFSELKNLKHISEYINSSENYSMVKSLKTTTFDGETCNLLNKKVHDRLNQHLIDKIKILNQLRASKIEPTDNVEFELYLTPDSTKIKLFTKMAEIKNDIKLLENRIGDWSIVTIIIN